MFGLDQTLFMTKKNRITETPPGEGGTPLKTTVMSDGSRFHVMADGRKLQEDGPDFRLVYQSVFQGSTYTRDIAIFGLGAEPHLFNAWCYTYNAERSYAFSKVVSLTEIATGETVTGAQLRKIMGGEE